MTNSKELYNDLISQVTLDEDKSEIQSIVFLLLEKKIGLTKTDILAEKKILGIQPSYFRPFIKQINEHTPIQYVLGEAEFYNRKFSVNSSVLIPRPETEIMIHEIKRALMSIKSDHVRILDIGTGSGCIAITLALEIPQANVQATDISKEAIGVALQNSKKLNAPVIYHEHNILTNDILFGNFDLVISNPPYISEQEKGKMKKNVIEKEPHLALFAPSDDPLAFYKAIALKSKTILNPEGSVWVEINEQFGNNVIDIFMDHGFQSIRLIKDLDNKDRIISAQL